VRAGVGLPAVAARDCASIVQSIYYFASPQTFQENTAMRFFSTPLTRRASHRPRLEALEERRVPTAGDLDATFGSGGIVDTVYVNMALLRYNTDGSLDPTFGTGGVV
jgi:hypothetical protein